MVKVAVIGVGSMGYNHTRVYADMQGVKLVGISDLNLEQAKFVAGKFGTHAFKDYRKLLEKTKPEAVSVAVPTSLHEAVATDVLQSGAHVLVEKPISTTLEEGKRLIACAKKMERKLMVGHITRFNPAILVLKEQLEAGKLGRIIQIFCRRVGPLPTRNLDTGVVVDLAPHDLDIMRFLTGLEPLRVYAETERQNHTDYNNLLFAVLHFPQSITGALEINWLTPTKLREVLVLGERGLFRMNDLLQDLYFHENSQVVDVLYSQLQNIKSISEGSITHFTINRIEPLRAELDAFINCIHENKPSPICGEDGLAALRLALALVESGQKHQVIEL